MKSNKELLSSILKTTQMGQTGIRSVINAAQEPTLRMAMRHQLEEYDSIEKEAYSLARKYNWTLNELNETAKFYSTKMAKMKLALGNVDSTIASMMIRGNVSGIIKGYRNMNQLSEPDAAVCALSQKLLDTESSNINQMKPFL